MKSILSKVLTSVLIVAFFAACTQTVTYLSPKEGRLIRGQSSVLV